MSASSSHAYVMGDPAYLRGRAAESERAAEDRRVVAAKDIFLSQAGRLDDRTRAATLRLAEATVCSLEGQVAGAAARALRAIGRHDAAAVLQANAPIAWRRLLDAGLMYDAELIGEFIAQARVDLLDESLMMLRAPDAGPTLATMLVEHSDDEQRAAVMAYLIADATRRLAADGRRAALPRPLYARVCWWVAAALREQVGTNGGVETDVALCEAAQLLIERGDDVRVEDAAAALARTLAPAPEQRAELMVQSLNSARTILFAALLADALEIDVVVARALVLDSVSDRLWLALRAAGLARDTIAHAGFLLSEADRERPLATLIESLDAVAALEPEIAGQAMSALRLPPEFRASVRALAARAAR